MLYETCARAEELLPLNIEDLDLAGRCARMKSKGAKPRTRGPVFARVATEMSVVGRHGEASRSRVDRGRAGSHAGYSRPWQVPKFTLNTERLTSDDETR